MNKSSLSSNGFLSLDTRLINRIFLFTLFGLVIGLTKTEAQTLCPNFGNEKILVENESQNEFSNPQLQVLGENIFLSGYVGYYDGNDNFFGKYQVRKIIKTGTASTILSNVTVSPMAIGDFCNTTIGTKVLSNGNFFIYWYSNSSGCSIQDAYFKILNPNGDEVRPTQKINTNSASTRLVRFLDVEQLSNGTIAVVYATSGSNYAMRRFTEAGQPIDNSELSITQMAGISNQSQYTHKIVANKNGQFLIFIDYYSARYKVLIFNNQANTPFSSKDIQAGPSGSVHVDKKPFAKALPDGKFLLAYQVQNSSGTETRGSAFQLLNSDGTTAKAEQRLPNYYSWGALYEPVLTKDGFLIQYDYNDFATGPSLGIIPYLIKYDFSGNKIADLKPNCGPKLIDQQFGDYGYFTDIDGDLGFYLNDKPRVSATSLDFSLIRRPFGPTVLIDTVQVLTNTTAKVEVDPGQPGGLIVLEEGVIFIDTLISKNPLLETGGIGKISRTTVGLGNFEANLTGLSPDKVYAVKAYVKISFGRAFYSEPKFFSTNTAPSFNHQLTNGILAISVPENTTSVLDILAADPDPDQTLSFSVEGADAALFEVNSTTKKLSFKTPPDLEDPKDQNKDNAYELVLTVTDNSASPKSSQINLKVTLTNVAEKPAIQNLSVTDLGANGAKINAKIISNGGGGEITASGFFLSTSAANQAPQLGGTGVTVYQIGTTLGDLSKLLTGLQQNTSYSYRAFVTNATGTSLTDVGTFTTLSLAKSPPVISYEDSNLNEINKTITTISPTSLGSSVPENTYAQVSTFTNNVSAPRGMVMDAFGNIYVAETGGKRISRFAPNGTKTVIRQFDSFQPADITIDSKTGDLYAVILTHRVLWIPNTNKANYPAQQPTHVWTNDATNVFAGASVSGTTDGVAGTNARFSTPLGITISSDNTYLLVADLGSHRIRKIDIATKMVTTFAGSTTSGTANGNRLSQARFQNPEDVIIAPDGSVYVTELNSTNHRVRKITGDEVSTLSGSGSGLIEGPGSSAKFNEPRGVTADAEGNVYVVEGVNHVVRQIASDGTASILAGSPASGSGSVDGVGYTARFNKPEGIYFAPDGFLYVVDTGGNRICKVSLSGYELTGNLPQGMSFDLTKGQFSGRPTYLSLKPYYVSNFEESISYQAPEGTITPTLVDNATQLGSLIRLTPSSNFQNGGITIPASGRVDRELQVDFDLVTGKGSGGADGISYSFAADADASTTNPRAEIGTGSGLSLSFNTYVGGIRLYYGANKAQTNTVGQSGLLAYSNSSSWRGKSVQVSISIIRDSVSVYLDKTLVFDRIALPAEYKTTDLTQWKHVIKSRTGGSNDIHAVDRLSISQGYGQSSVQVIARNTKGKFSTFLNFSVIGPPVVMTSPVSEVQADKATSGLVLETNGNSPLIKKGLIWGTTPGLTLANALGKTDDSSNQNSLVLQITGLSEFTTYYVRAYAENKIGVGYGQELTFKTPLSPPNIKYGSNRIVLKEFLTASIAVTNSGGAVPKVFANSVSTLAGLSAGFLNGQGTAARFNVPNSVAVDKNGNLYVADQRNHVIRKITPGGLVSTLAGSTQGFLDGQGTAARFDSPAGIAVDVAGNIYVSESGNHRIRKITPSGSVSTLAGSSQGFLDGQGTSAKFENPSGVAVDAAGNVYVSEIGLFARIRKITPGGLVSTLAGSSKGFADGQGTAARFDFPRDLDVDAAGNVYVADMFNYKIRKITPGGVVSTLAGSSSGSVDGPATTAQFDLPSGVTVDAAGNIYVADQSNSTPKIRKITPDGLVSTLAGFTPGIVDGSAADARFSNPIGIAVDGSGAIYVSEIGSHRIRKIDPIGWSISPALPAGLALTTDGNITGTPTAISSEKEYTLIATNTEGRSTFNFRLEVQKFGLESLTLSTGTLSPEFNSSVIEYQVLLGSSVSELSFTLKELFPGSTIEWKIGEGSFSSIASDTPSPSIPLEEGDNLLTIKVSDGGQSKSYTVRIKKPISPPLVTYVPALTLTHQEEMTPLQVSNSGGKVPSEYQNRVSTIAGSSYGFENGQGTSAKFSALNHVAVDASGNVYVADVNNHSIRKISPSGLVSTLAGNGTAGSADGQGSAARFTGPTGVAVDAAGNVYVSESQGYKVRKISPTGLVTTLAGSSSPGSVDGQGANARFGILKGIAVDAEGNVYVSDIRQESGSFSGANFRVNSSGTVSSPSPNSPSPSFGAPAPVSVFLNRIRKISPTGVVTTLAGSTEGFANGQGSLAKFNSPEGLAVDGSGNVYVADVKNQRIRKISPTGLVTTLAGGFYGSQDGQGINAQFGEPNGVTVDPFGNVYVAELYNHTIRKISPSGLVTTVAGTTSNSGNSDGLGRQAKFNYPAGLATDGLGNLFVADRINFLVRKVETTGWSVSPSLPAGLTLNKDGSISGTPTALSPPRDYIITGVNAGGSSTYTIRIEVTAGATEGLRKLTVNQGRLSPAFRSERLTYDVQVESTIDALSFIPTAVNTNAQLSLNGNTITNAVATGSYTLNFGPNTFKFLVKESGGKEITYEVVVTRALAPPVSEILWEGTGSKKWSAGSNWKGNSRPASGADVKFSPTALNDLEADEDFVAGTIDFNGSNKKVVLVNNSLTVSGFAGLSISNFVELTGTGRLKINIGSNLKALYPVGNQSYTPVSITNKTGQPTEFSLGIFTDVYEKGNLGSVIPNARIKRTWDISNSANSVSGSGIDLEFSWTATEASGVKNPALYHYENGAWVKLDAAKTTVDLNGRILIYKGYTGSLSPFAIFDELPTETPLTISAPTLTKIKSYDGNTSAVVTAGALAGVASGEDVTVSSVATYDNALAGTGKTIRVVYTLGGADASKYIKPVDDVFTDGEITKIQLTATAATVTTSKIYDGSTNAAVTAGTLSGKLAGESVGLIASANYSTAFAGTNKAITVSYTLDGSDAGNYLPPVNQVFTNGEITRVALTVTIKDDAKFVGQADNSNYNGATITGFISGETVIVLSGSLVITRSNSGVNAAGEYANVLLGSGLSSPNYTITYEPGDFSILPADVLLVKFETSFTEYGNDPVYTISSSGYFSSGLQQLVDLTGTSSMSGKSISVFDGIAFSTANISALTPVLSTSGNLNVGTYVLGATDIKLSQNVNSLKLLGDLQVIPRILQVDVSTGELKEYDGTRDMVGVTTEPTGVLVNDLVTTSFGSALYEGSSAKIQPYTIGEITLSGADAVNYSIKSEFIGQGQITAKVLTVSGTAVTKVKPYDGKTETEVSLGTVTGILNKDVVTVKPSAQFLDKYVGKNKTINLSYTLEGPNSGNYIAPVAETFTGGEVTKKSLGVTDPSLVLKKAYDGTRKASVEAGSLIGLVSGDNVEITASALYDNPSVGTGKKITVSYSLSGSDTLNYQTSLQNFESTQGEIYATGPVQLLITEPTLSLSKNYDAKTEAAVTVGTLIGLTSGDVVTVIGSAIYENAQVGTGKKITVSYTLSGTDAGEYVAPPDYVVTTGEIKKISLTITAPTLKLIKDFDGTATATVQALGTVSGVVGSEDVTVKASAVYQDSVVSKNKKITVTYTLDGADKGNYLAPVVFEVTNGEIREVIQDIDGDGIVDSDDPDTDGDGIENTIEEKVPSASGSGKGDGNGDGIEDYLQAHVVSFRSEEKGLRGADQYVTLATPVGNYKFSEVISEKKPAGLARSVSSRLPIGVTKFTLSGLSSGEEVGITAFVDKTIALTGYFKQPNGQTVWNNLLSGGISKGIEKASLLFKIQDNGTYDLNQVGGILKDPGLITAYPMIFSNGGEEEAEFEVKENRLAVTKVEASDKESSTFTYGIEMGVDEALFEMDTVTGVLSFKAAPDFENPSDSDGDNVYELIVNAFASNGTIDRQWLYITVEDDNDTPSFLTPKGGIAYLRGLTEFEDVAMASSTDENPGDDMLGAGFNGEQTLDLFTLFGDQDQDEGNTLTGIAISENSADATTEGVWEYSTDLDALVWHQIGKVSKDSALLLDLEGFLRFVPVPNFFGSPKGLKVHPVDGSGATVEPEINSGGGTAWTFDINKKYYTALKEDSVNSSVGAESIEVNIEVEGTEDLPQAKEVGLSGTAKVELVLTGSYTFEDVDGDTELGTTLTWFRSETGADGTWEEITGETGDTYTLILADLDQYIRFGVRPNDGKGFGDWAYSDKVGPVQPNDLVDLRISDPLIVLEKVYDGTTDLEVTPGVLSGILKGDVVTVQATAALDTPDAGEGKGVEVRYTLSGKDADRYRIPKSYKVNTGKVTKALLKVKAVDKQKVFGETDPSFTVTYSGFVNGESEEVLGGSLEVNREPLESVGTYDIIPSGLSSGNYELGYEKGKLTVISKPIDSSDIGVEAISELDYLGLAQTPSPVVNDGVSILTVDVDYTLSYSANTNAGKATVTITGKGNYSGTVKVEFDILPLDLMVNPATGLKKKYGEKDPDLTYTYSGNIASETPDFESKLTRASGESAGEYDISLGSLSLKDNGSFKAANYRIKLQTGIKLTVEKAKLTVKVNSDSKFVTQTDAAGYAGVSYEGFAFGEDESVLDESNLTITRSNSAVETAGSYPGVLKANGVASGNYEFEYTDGDYTIVAADRLLVKIKKTEVIYGNTPGYLVESAQYLSSSGNQVVDLTSTSIVTGNKVEVVDGVSGKAEFDLSVIYPQTSGAGKLAVGNYVLENSNLVVTSANFNNTVFLRGGLKVTPLELSVSVSDGKEKVYDSNAQMLGLQLALTTALSGDELAVSGTGVYADKIAGDRDYEVSGLLLSGVDAKNYFLTGGATAKIQGTDGKITPRELTVTPDEGQEKAYGTQDPELTYTWSGQVIGEDPGFTGSLEREAGETTGTYAITVGSLSLADEGSFLSENYSLKLITGKLLTVKKAVVRIIADDQTKIYGENNPVLTFSYEGLADGDTQIAVEPTIETTATSSSGVGTYPITLKGGSDSNYDFELVDGVLTVTKATVTITAENKEKIYGEVNPELTFSYGGLLNGDTKVTTEPSITTTATAGSGAGVYPITLTGGSDPNYDIKLKNGVFTVGKAQVTVTADDTQRAFGAANPALTFTYKGLVNGDTKIATEPTITTSATASSAVGTYPITLSGGADSNYDIDLKGGTLTVGKAKLTITADDKTKAFGTSNPTLTFSYSGLVNGDTKVATEPTATTTAIQNSVVGTYPITLSGGSDSNYDIELKNGVLTVGKSKVIITADNKQKTYGDSNPALTFTYSGLINGDTKVSTEPSIATTATAASSVGTYPISLTGGSDPNYDIELKNGTLTISKKGLTITADNKQKIYGDSNPALTFTYSGLINGDTKVSTEPSIATTATAASSVGTYPVTLTGGSDQNYDLELKNGTLTIGKKGLTITTDNKQKTYGDSNPALTFTYSGLVNGDTKVSTEPGIATTATAASSVGTYPITLTGGSDSNYDIELKNGALTIVKKVLTITAVNKQKVYGEANPALTFTYSGLVNGDTKVTTEPSIATMATAASDAGTYPITLTGGSDPNYNIERKNGTLTIVKKGLTITADNKQKTYGDSNPALTFTYIGLVNGDMKVTTEPSIATTATVASSVGTYPVTLTGGSDLNYDIELKNGTLNIGKKGLTITADNKQKTYGDSNPVLTFTYSGLVNGDMKVTTEPNIATTAIGASNAGTYPITLTGGSDLNYDIELKNGTLTIGKKGLTITADNMQKTYGDSNPALTFTYSGLVNGDIKVTTEPNIATTATAASNAGTYPITLTGGSDPNYDIELKNGTLTIGKKGLTITADNKQKTYGDSNPALTFTYSGLVNGGMKVTTEPNIATTATAASNAGTYPITLTGGSDPNYDIELKNGTLTIGKKGLTITADNKQKTYGDSNPALTFTYSGLINGDLKVSTEPSIVTTATAASNVGTYPITLTGGSDLNYDIELKNGTLTIGKKGLTITADNKQKTYGDSNPALTFTYSGLVNEDSKVSTEPSIVTTATAASNVGIYPITLSGGEDQNYTITLVSAELEILATVLRVSADNKMKVFGKTDPTLTYQVSGLKGADKASDVITGALIRVAGEVPGVYAIGQGTLKANSNYVMAFTDGSLEIVAARILSVTELGVITTDWGKNPVLPTKVTVLTTDGQLFEVGVGWNTVGLNILKRGTYTIRGTFNLPNGIENPDEIIITVAIRVAAKPAPRDVTLNKSTFIGSADEFFIEVGAFVVDDPVDRIHPVTLLGGGYDNKYFEIKNNILFWSSADRADGKTEFTIVIRVTDRDGNTLDKMFTITRTRPSISQIEVENTFTPDGDGKNDGWGVPEIRFYKGARVQVFERSGERVFYTEDPDVRWDGTYKGKEMPVGTYYWVFELRETGETRKGLLNLIRR